jgi:hypothetical protein
MQTASIRDVVTVNYAGPGIEMHGWWFSCRVRGAIGVVQAAALADSYTNTMELSSAPTGDGR